MNLTSTFLTLLPRRVGLMAFAVALSCMAWADESGESFDQRYEVRTIGTYPIARNGHSVTIVGGGRLFLHGAHIYRKQLVGDPKDNELLMRRREAPLTMAERAGVLTREPWLWLPERRGWKHLGDVPECRGDPYLQVATPMPDGGVLLTGGLCDEAKMIDDPSKHPEYLRTSRLNGQNLTWERSPDLLQGRMYHTASLLSDGRVVVVGGQRDPGLGSDHFPVLLSVEWLVGDHFEAVGGLNQGRAGHTATVLAEDAILVTGGFDDAGKALASVERWDRASQRWHTLPPLKQARYGHRATLLADGRLLVTGGFDEFGKPLASAEWWDPISDTWSEAPTTPAAVGFHDAARLANGDVLLAPMITKMDSLPQPATYLWRASNNAWEMVASVRADDWRYLGFIPVIDPLADGSARLFGAAFIWHWASRPSFTQDEPLNWQGTPALARLDDRSVIVVALSQLDGVSQRRAYRWESDTGSGTWTAAGRLHQTRSGHAQAIRLESGYVLHLAEDAGNSVYCDMSTANLDNREWEFCGRLEGKVLNDSPFELGLLPDGRGMVITNFEEAFIFDESRRQWRAASLEWRTAEQSFGSPVKSGVPLAQVVETSDSGEIVKLDVSAQAARFWGWVTGRRNQAILSDGVEIRRVAGRATPPAMLWNANKMYWDYIFPNNKMIGRNPIHLPDGCAISLSPPSLFDPKSGTARMLDTYPAGLGTGDKQFVVLGDGSVVAVSAPVGGAVSGWFVGHASCAGLTDTADLNIAMSPVFVTTPPPAPVVSVDPPPAPQVPGWSERSAARIAEIPSLTWVALVTILILALVRRWLSKRNVGAGSPRHSRLDQPVGTRLRYLLRIVVWLGVLVILGPAVVNYVLFRQAAEATDCFENAKACLDRTSRLIKSIPSLGDGRPGTATGPHIPCRFVGQWSSIHAQQIRRITLADDGSYQMMALVQGGDPATSFNGNWMVQSGHFVWRDAKGSSELDITVIDSESDGVFTLIEANGSRTRFERIESIPSSRCLPD